MLPIFRSPASFPAVFLACPDRAGSSGGADADRRRVGPTRWRSEARARCGLGARPSASRRGAPRSSAQRREPLALGDRLPRLRSVGAAAAALGRAARRLLRACARPAARIVMRLGVPGAEIAIVIVFAMIGVAPIAFLIGLLRARLARASVGDLVVELAEDPSPAALEGALARALGDPSLALATGFRTSRATPTRRPPMQVATAEGRRLSAATARGRARAAGRAGRGPGAAQRGARATSAGALRGRRLLPRLREPRERRQVCGLGRRRSSCPAPARCPSRSQTTAWGARTPNVAPGCAASPTASRRSTAACGSGAPPGGGTRLRAEFPCAS